jgi:hypothetical protein
MDCGHDEHKWNEDNVERVEDLVAVFPNGVCGKGNNESHENKSLWSSRFNEKEERRDMIYAYYPAEDELLV